MNENSDRASFPNKTEIITNKELNKITKEGWIYSQSARSSIKHESGIFDPKYTEKLAKAVEDYNQVSDSRRTSNMIHTPTPSTEGSKEDRTLSQNDDVVESEVNNFCSREEDTDSSNIYFKSLDELDIPKNTTDLQNLSVKPPQTAGATELTAAESTSCLVNVSNEVSEINVETRKVRSNSSVSSNKIKPNGIKVNTMARKVPNFSETRLGMRVSTNEFNRNPVQGLAMLLLTKSVGPSPNEIARFCISNLYISKEKVGELLGSISNRFCLDILEEFGKLFDFKGSMIHEALRLFQTYFRMPGEAQKIQSVVEAFANRFFECNMNLPNEHGYVYKEVDTIVVLSYAIIMLNVDQHNPQVKMKMTAFEFSDNILHAPGCEDIPSIMLDQIYENIRNHEFKVGNDHLSQLFQLEVLYPMKNIKIACPGRHFIGIYIVTEIISEVWSRIHTKSRNLLVFNDIIICIRDTSIPNTFLRKNNRSNLYKSTYELKNCELKLDANHKYTLTFSLLKLRTNQVVASFRCSTEDAFHKLTNLIYRFIEEVKWSESVKKVLPKGALNTIVEYVNNSESLNDQLEAFGINLFGGNYKDLLTD